MRISFFVLLISCIALCISAETIKAPELTPALTNQHEQALIDEGTALHNQGKFEEAIQKYKQVLEKSPKNVLAIYEMASSYFSAKKYEEALKTSYEGARYKSRYLAKFYLFIGNSLDELGRTDEAISSFRSALEVVSDDPMIHFNLAVILVNSGKPATAQPHLEKAVELNPTHSSSYYALSQVYFDQNNRIPGILAILYFLFLEPQSKRSSKAITILNENLLMTKDSENTQLEQKINLLNDLFKTMAESGSNEGKFASVHYAYFFHLQKVNLVPVFTYYIYQSTDPTAAKWVEQHTDQIQKFLKWSKTPTYVE